MRKIAGTWLSNSVHAPTGYGTQTRQVVTRMNADGHAIAVAANYGVETAMATIDGVTHYPRGLDGYSMDTFGPHYDDWTRQHPDHAHHAFVLFDAWVLHGDRFDDIPTAIWVPIDHHPAPVGVVDFLRRRNVTPIAMSAYGAEQIRQAGVDCVHIPHALDLRTWRPTGRVKVGGRMMTGREMMGLPESGVHVTGLFNANKGGQAGFSRKAWAESMLAWWMWAQGHDDARLYVHTNGADGGMGGLNLHHLIDSLGIPGERYVIVNQYAMRLGLPAEAVACLMTACDVTLAATMGEGFGLTVLESQSVGTRVIASDFSAQPELVADGWLVRGQPAWDASAAAWFTLPLVESIMERLEDAYRAPRGISQRAIDFVAAGFDADRVYAERWRPLLERLADPDANPSPALPWSTPAPPADPALTVYVPTYRRRELAALLSSLAPQLTDRCEVVVADNAADAREVVERGMADAPCRVEYLPRPRNIGGDANIIAGFTEGRAPWVWVVGDDDTAAPGAIDAILAAIDADDHDRLILLSDAAPRDAAGVSGNLADIAAVDPALPLAATLISANVVRRAACDVAAALPRAASHYGQAWAWPSERVLVLDRPCLARVGFENAGGLEPGFDGPGVKAEYLDHVGVPVWPALTGWNYMSVQATREAAR